MTQSPSLPFQQVPAFQTLSPEGLQRLEGSAQLLRYRLGQVLVSPAHLPAKVSLILEGSARLLGSEQGELATRDRLGPGAIVCLASLLPSHPC